MANTGVVAEGGGSSSIYKAIVIDVMIDGQIPGDAANQNKLDGAPENSCLVRFYGNPVPAGDIVAYPFFPQHLQVPIKPGEAVWVISPSITEPDINECYWVGKIATSQLSNNVNYSHPFRKPQPPEPSSAGMASKKEAADAGNPETPSEGVAPGFLNNDGNGPVLKGGKDPFSLIFSNSEGFKYITPEPVAGFHKRPGDLVLQGSNNTLINLGQDRGFSTIDYDLSAEITGSSYKQFPTTGSGTIDIVAGRSRYFVPPDKSPLAPDVEVDPPERSSFFSITNTRGFDERNMAQSNNRDGDVDFAVDASRLYVSMKTDGDKNFALTNEFHRMPASIVTGSIQPASGSAYIVAKSDEIRIVARKQEVDEYFPTIGNPAINGSIKIIKEGKADDDLAAVVLQPDGSVQISGSRIFLGRHPDDGGIDESQSGPDDALQAQPYVRYQQLEDLLNAVMDNIEAFCDTLNTHVTPGYGNPSPQILEAAATLKADIATRRGEIETLKSSRIFGE
tara:strand:+ start:1995 stop:3512 length:1518 start_codon:yes stop_codon:yes gene_type:complete